MDEFDFIVVGAGSAGCVVARRLVERGLRVLILEAGPSDENLRSLSDPVLWASNIASDHDWKYFFDSSPHVDHRRILLSRGKVLGGSSSINALVWARGHSSDFDRWAADGNEGWDFESVLPFFKKAEDWEDGETELRGAGGPIRVERAKNLHGVAAALIDAARCYGIPYIDDMNGPTLEGAGPINMNVRNGARESTSRAYLRPIMGKPLLTVLTGAKALRLIVDSGRCTGVEYLHEGALKRAHAAAEVVLSAGAIDSPRLLLLSGIGNAKDLRALHIPVVADLPGVGQNLQDHIILAGLAFEARGPLMPFNNNLEGSTFFYRSRGNLIAPDLTFVPLQVPFLSPELAAIHSMPPNAFCIAPGLMRIASRGELRILSSKHDGPMRIQPNMLAEPEDLDALVVAVEVALDVASQPPFREYIERWLIPERPMDRAQSIAFIRKSCSSYSHPVGTCAMGSGPDAVVDAKLKVHGIDGLRVVDASIMPRAPSANTNAPTIMIGEMAAALLSEV
ncbi:MAG: GMC family oxidoreductase N-terminal domain-containing protein [Gammaproteobacteria bacterium]